MNDPEILILDEPTNGLDPQGIHQIRDIIRKIASQGTTILLASHLLDEVEKVCSHVVVLRKGEILYSGSVDAMSANEGFFEISSNDNLILKSILNDHPAVGQIKEEDGKIIGLPKIRIISFRIKSVFIFEKYCFKPFDKTQKQFRSTIFRINQKRHHSKTTKP